MPAQVTHMVFAEDALVRALGDEGREIVRLHGPSLVLGAQGPDMFYHNQRTRPSALFYGKLLHRGRYGTCVRGMVSRVRHDSASSDARSRPNGPSGADSIGPAGVFTLGFATHAALDRTTHPFIIYFSGWVDPHRPETAKYALCHAFLERIHDVVVYREHRGAAVAKLDFLGRVNCGQTLPSEIEKTLVAGITTAYPARDRLPVLEQRLRNAYRDTIGFYRWTNPADGLIRDAAKVLDRMDHRGVRRLALFHPPRIPAGYDFLNEAHREWRNPSYPDLVSVKSFLELYDEALDRAVPMVRIVAESLLGNRSLDEIESAVGNENLNDGRSLGPPAPSLVSDPLPLPELIDELIDSR